jgi:Autographiviridae endonuclease VII
MAQSKEYFAKWAREHRESKRAAYRRWEQNNPDKATAKSRVRVCAKKGITPEVYADLLTKQEGRCAICRTADPGRKSWCIDHDHVTGKVRGLLCWKCNLALGWYEKQLQFYMNAVEAYRSAGKFEKVIQLRG